jgi:hypothetical protein
MNSTNNVQLFEISYVSKATQVMRFSSKIHLFDVCLSKNRVNNLTGVLFYENGHFSQILEGEQETILKTWESIEKDPRHQILRKITFKKISQRSFPNWALRLYGGDKFAEKLPHLKGVLDGLESHDTELLKIMRSVAINN